MNNGRGLTLGGIASLIMALIAIATYFKNKENSPIQVYVSPYPTLQSTSSGSELPSTTVNPVPPVTSTHGVGIVFDPPSNVRWTPNGGILCSVHTRTTINILGSVDDWYYTDVCGETGVIHKSQIKF